MKYLILALKQNKVVKYLFLKNNNFVDEHFSGLFDVTKNHQSLEKVHIIDAPQDVKDSLDKILFQNMLSQKQNNGCKCCNVF